MRILVTGAAGFLGWNLTRRLRELGPEDEIVGLDNLWTGQRRTPEWVSEMVVDEVESSGVFPRGRFHEVWHLASPASPCHYQAAPLNTITANVMGLINCAHWMRDGGTLFLASTSEVYGDPLVSPQPETYNGSVNSLGPRACYDNSKRLCETIMMDLRREGRRFEPRIARLFNVYGPGTLPDDGRAISNFVAQALEGRPLTVMGTGRQTRCFTYVDDVIEAMVRLVRNTSYPSPVNIGTDTETTVLEAAQTVSAVVATITGAFSAIRRVAPAVDDPQQRRPDLERCREVLRWRASTPLDEGVLRTARYMREMMLWQR